MSMTHPRPNVKARADQPSTSHDPRGVGYEFDRPPVIARHKLRDGEIGLLEYAVISAILHFHYPPRDWVWTTYGTLGGMLGKSEDSIARAVAKLIAAKLLERHRVPSPDPDCPENRTGWRWRLLWLDPIGATPAEVRPPQACGSRRSAEGPSMETPQKCRVHTPQKCVGAPPAEVRPNPDGVNPDGVNQDDDKTGPSSSETSLTREDGGKAVQTAQDRPGRDSSPDPDPTPKVAADRPEGDLGPLIIEAVRRFPDCDEAKVRDAVGRYSREWVEAVVWGEPRTEGWGGVNFLLRKWKADGKPNQRAVEAARAAIDKAKLEAQRLAEQAEQAKRQRAIVAEARRQAARTAAETLLDDIRLDEHTIASDSNRSIVVIAPPSPFRDSDAPWAKGMNEERAKRTAELQRRLGELQDDVKALLEVSPVEDWLPMDPSQRELHIRAMHHIQDQDWEKRRPTLLVDLLGSRPLQGAAPAATAAT